MMCRHGLAWGHGPECPIPSPQGGYCRQCFKPRRAGWTTCGKSECQEAEARANKERNKRKSRARKVGV